MKPALLFFLATCLSCLSAKAQIITASPLLQNTYTNPVIADSYADPSYILADNGYFYLYGTGENIMKSKDLVNWTYVGRAFSTHRPDFVTGVKYYWAPCINKINDQYVLYFAMSKWGGIDNCGIGVAVSSTPEGPFMPYDNPLTAEKENGKLFLSYEIGVRNSIDPCYIEDNGHKYMFWGSFYGIYAIELSDDGLTIKPGAQKTKIAGNAYEGTYIYKKDGYYYFFGSKGSCCDGANSTYTTVCARSTNLLGPYTNKIGELLTNNKHEIMISGNSKWAGTGHNAEITTDINGNTWILYHAYSKKNPEIGRMVLMDQVKWENNWPYIEGGTPSSRAAAPILK